MMRLSFSFRGFCKIREISSELRVSKSNEHERDQNKCSGAHAIYTHCSQNAACEKGQND